MYQTALLLLTGPLRVAAESIGKYLNYVGQNASKKLYIKLEPELCKPFSKLDSPTIGRLSSVLPLIYDKTSSILRNVDVRVLITNHSLTKHDEHQALNFDVILTNSLDEDRNIIDYVERNFFSDCHTVVKLKGSDSGESEPSVPDSEFRTFGTVCLGGTFDRLHSGHKVLLSESILRASEKLIIGVSEGPLLKKKVLSELIEPIEDRIQSVTEFLHEVDPSIEYEVVSITDPYGPTITDPDINCIVVTTETKVGGEKVNVERAKRGMTQLEMFVVEVISNTDHQEYEEEKMSSSTNRMRLLGTPLKSHKQNVQKDIPGCIILQGISQKDKSIIANYFQALGLPVLCCDQMIESIFRKDETLKLTAAQKLSEMNSSFTSTELAATCFRNEAFREWLVDAVCNKLKLSLHQVLDVYFKQDNCKVVLVKGSTILEGCDLGVNVREHWTTILPVLESSKRFKEEYSLQEEEVESILRKLPTNKNYVDAANIVFCNDWSTEAVQEQINRSWCYLKSSKVVK